MDVPLWAKIAAVASMSYLLRATADRAWSELIFICLCVWLLVALEDHHSLRVLIPLAALACLARYAGVTLIITGVIVLALRREWQRAAWFGVLASAPLGIWLARNWLLAGTLVGPRVASAVTVKMVAFDYVAVILTWFVQVGLIFGTCYGVDRLFRRIQRVHHC